MEDYAVVMNGDVVAVVDDQGDAAYAVVQDV